MAHKQMGGMNGAWENTCAWRESIRKWESSARSRSHERAIIADIL